jgi:CheY-like chemotaxis protein
MDHSYRTAANGNGARNGGGARFRHPELEALPAAHNGAPRIFAFIDDLFFLAKIQETARKLNVKVQFVKSEKEVLDSIAESEQAPSLIIMDLNNSSVKPISAISKLKSKLKKQSNIIGFLSHVQGDLKLKAQEAGCDMVLPRSAFSQNLPQLLRRHGSSAEPPATGAV